MNKRVLDYYTGMSKFWGCTNVSSWKTCYGIASMDVVSRERFWKGENCWKIYIIRCLNISPDIIRGSPLFLFFFLSRLSGKF